MAIQYPYARLERLWNEDICTVAAGMRHTGMDKLRHGGHNVNLGRARKPEVEFKDRDTGRERFEYYALPPGDFPYPMMMVSHKYWSENLTGIGAALAFNSLNCSSDNFDFHLPITDAVRKGPDTVYIGVHGHAIFPILVEGVRESAKCDREKSRKGFTSDLIYTSPSEDNAYESYAKWAEPLYVGFFSQNTSHICGGIIKLQYSRPQYEMVAQGEGWCSSTSLLSKI